MSKQQQMSEEVLLKLILTAIEPWSTHEITEMVQNMVIPKLEFITPLIKSPIVLNGLRVGFQKYEKEINLYYFNKGIDMFRKDLIPILNTSNGILWKKTMLKRVQKWGKSL